MATNIDITFETDRAQDVIDNVTVLLADSYLMGYQNKILEYTNVLSIVKIAKEYLLYSTVITVDHNKVSNALYIIREYLSYLNIKSIVDYFTTFTLNECYGDTNNQQITPSGHAQSLTPPDQGINDEIMDFREYTVPVTQDSQTTFDMPFNVANVDVEYITMTVGGDNPKYTVTGVGFHMEADVLHWHGDYPLRVGYEIVVKYVV